MGTPDGVPRSATRPRGIEPGWALNIGCRLPLSMGASLSSQTHGMSPRMQVKRTDAQHTKKVALMVDPVISILMNINDFGRGKTHFKFELQKPGISELWCTYSNVIVALVIVLLIHMLRERGKPRRGTAWFSFDARRKRQQRFERALSMA
jgi:hypothetical protein